MTFPAQGAQLRLRHGRLGGRLANGSERVEPIAITGIGCRLPDDCNGPDTYWRNVLAGRDLIRETPPDRWNAAAYHSPDRDAPGRMYARWGGFIRDPDRFDAPFFGIAPREALRMDPQQRWLLEITWEALEDAGCPPAALAGTNVGVFVGISSSDYSDLQQRSRYDIDAYTNSGNAASIAANRISYVFDWRGPSVAVDTACSSSLVALDLACRAMLDGEVAVAIVAGVNALFTPEPTIGFSKASMLSPDGRCKAFDAAANGYVRAEGAACVVLRPLADALAAGDRIYAVIRSTFVNQDGRTGSMTVPSLDQQVALLAQAYRRADVQPAHVGYVEAHGTGTPVGDPIEATALGRALGVGRSADQRLWIGSVKSNLGHLEPASGVAGLAKLALALYHRTIPPSLHFRMPNPHIAFDELGLRVPTEAMPWEPSPGASTLYGGVNSFGFGGTNAHAVLASAPAQVAAHGDSTATDSPSLWTVSARSQEALREAVRRDAAWLHSAHAPFAELARSVKRRRSHHAHRLAIVADTAADCARELTKWTEKGAAESAFVGQAHDKGDVVFVFSGQGSQWPGMGLELFEHVPLVRETFERWDALLQPLWEHSLVDVLRRRDDSVFETDVGQPLFFVLQVALARLLEAWGIRPARVLGHSVGEVAAAHVAGALNDENAARVIVERSRAQARTRGPWAMAAVGLGEDSARKLIDAYDGAIEIAAVNASAQVTVAGKASAVDALAHDLSGRGVFVRVLPLAYAFHTHAMDPVHDAFDESVRALRAHAAAIPYTSSVTGAECAGEALDAAYWWRNLREPVRFAAAMRHAIGCGHRTFVEVGAHPSLVRYIAQALDDENAQGAAVGTLKRDAPAVRCMLETVAALHVRGFGLRWEGVQPGPCPHHPFPTYPWQRQSFWAESDDARALRIAGPLHPLLGIRERGPALAWQSDIDVHTHPYLVDHGLDGKTVFPAAGYIELMLAAMREGKPDSTVELRDVHFERVLWLDEPHLVQTAVDERGRIIINAKPAHGSAQWQQHVRGRGAVLDHPRGASNAVAIPDDATSVDVDALYERFERAGHRYGPLFRTLRWAGRTGGALWGRIALDSTLAPEAARWLLHPALLDGALQLTLASMPIDDERDALYLPVHAERIRWLRPADAEVVCRVSGVHHQDVRSYADIALFTPSGEPIATLLQCCCMKKVRGYRLAAGPARLYREAWIESELADESNAPIAPLRWLIVDLTGDADALAHAMVQAGFYVHRCSDADTPGGSDAIVVWAGSSPSRAQPTDEVLVATWRFAQLAQSLCAEAKPVRLVLVTSGATWGQLPAQPVEPDLGRAPLAALLRTIAIELPRVACRLIDVDAAEPREQLTRIVGELRSAMQPSEVAYRAGRRFVSRVQPQSLDELAPRSLVGSRRAGADFRLESAAPGNLDHLHWVESEPARFGDAEVEIDVRAVGLNFRDVLKALDLYPLEPQEQRVFGDECAGVVRRVGSAVTAFRAGDEVLAIAPGCFGNVVRVHSCLVARKPAAISFEQAASIPIAFITADYALNDVARLQPGETVLVHAAAGGVGLAAVQIARACGATVLGTASPEKHDLLRAAGVARVFHSRDLSFVDGVHAATGGAGVDVVLNSLSGELLAGSLELLKPLGRFVEIGKKDIFANASLDLHAFRSGASFHAVDVARVIAAQPAWIGARLEQLVHRISTGELRPLPVQPFACRAVDDAFRFMAQGRHRGKLVVTFDAAAMPDAIRVGQTRLIRDDGTYVVTGGLTGFGWATAEWLVAQGAKSLVLVSRTGALRRACEQTLACWRDAGVNARIARCDVTDAAAVTALFDDLAATESLRNDTGSPRSRGRQPPPLRGVFHSAMVLHDEPLARITRDAFERVLAPKVEGTWNLHRATEHLPLDHFVVYSSCATLLGSAAQAAYVAANRFVEALAALRRARGLPALAIGWGPIADFGVVSERPQLARHLENAGLGALHCDTVFGWLEFLMRRDVASAFVMQADWDKIGAAIGSASASGRFADVMVAKDDALPGGALRQMLAAAPSDARRRILVDHLRHLLASVLRADEATIDEQTPLTNLGLDSLMAFEFKVKLDRDLDAVVPLDRLASDACLAQLADGLLARFDAPALPQPPAPERPSVAMSTVDAVKPFLRIVSQAASSDLDTLSFDAAALVYLPDKLNTIGGLTDEQMTGIFGRDPFVSHYFDTPFGRIAAITLPVRSGALFRPEARTLLLQALDLADAHGARCVSLTGLIPSATDYGRAIEWWRNGTKGVPITTGHATTTAAVVRTLDNMMRLAGRDLTLERVAVVGVGSIGQSCVRLMLSVLPHPRELVLCDLFSKEHALRDFAHAIATEHAYQGSVRVVHLPGGVPDEVYAADTILAASSVADVLDVDRLRPGTIIVDDSYPPAFPLAPAIRRIEARADILFTNAGMLRLAEPVRQTFVLSAAAEAALRAFGADEFREQVARDAYELTACVLSSALTGRYAGFGATLGIASCADLISHYRELDAINVTSARLQCENYFVPDAVVARFGAQFGGAMQAAAD